MKRKLLIGAAIFAVLLLAAGALAYGYAFSRYDGATTTVYVPTGADEEDVRQSLGSVMGAGASDRVFTLWKIMRDGERIPAGAYRIEPGEAYVRIARRIALGRQTPVRVTWNNVRSLEDMAARISRYVEADSAEIVQAAVAAADSAGLSRGARLAAFLPDTYEVYWTAPADEIADKMLSGRMQFWNEERRGKAQKLGLTPVEVATLASIVEEETAMADERGAVARLYLNRLAKGMKLQADPTVKFAMGDWSIRRITLKMLSRPSAYNTYQNAGLPPGPIRIASAAAIDAVLDAPQHEYLFMCAKEDFSGRHNFATDYATHQANARRYQAELDRRGIKL